LVVIEAFSDATTGLVVPTYVTINSIEELNANKDKFKGEIIGIGGGAGLHRNTIKAIDVYDLDYDQVTSSGPAMVASLEKAIRDKEWIVVTGWKPHFKWAQHDLKYLKDPKGVISKRCLFNYQEEGFKKTNLRQLFFKTLILKKNSCTR
jgi:glycine betaine/proline transport system substrate-binding protein